MFSPSTPFDIKHSDEGAAVFVHTLKQFNILSWNTTEAQTEYVFNMSNTTPFIN